MPRNYLPFVLLAIATLQAAPVCEPSAPVLAIIVSADLPRDQQIDLEDYRRTIRGLLEKGLTRFPEDPFLHSELQDLDLGRIGENRPDVLVRYEKRLSQQPANIHRQYLVARAAYSHRTLLAVELLNKLLAAHPDYGPAHMLLAQIRASQMFHDEAAAKAALLAHEKACPTTPASALELFRLKDSQFLKEYTARLRKRLEGRNDLIAARSYPGLWLAEKSSSRSDESDPIVKAWDADIVRMRSDGFPRSRSWLDSLNAASFHLNKRIDWLGHDFAKYFPHSLPALNDAISEARNLTPSSVSLARLRELCKRYPASPGLGSNWFLAARKAEDSVSLLEAYRYMLQAMELDPDSYLTSPPFQIDMAQDMVQRKIGLELVPQFVFAGFSATEKSAGKETTSDLWAQAAIGQQRQHDYWYLFGYYTLIEAYALTGKHAEARDVLSQAQTVLSRNRPAAEASPEDRSRFAMFESRFWRVKGILAESRGLKLDALIAYRNALESYGPQSARGDDRFTVLAAAQRVSKELGGSPETWNDWESRHPLMNLRTGDGGPNAWLALAAKQPELKITAMNGRQYTAEELSKTTSFVNVWATWCMPCREELPYLEKLAARFAGRDEFVFVALNVDEEQDAVVPFLERFKFGFKAAMAYGFAYDILPVFGVPANYIIRPGKTSYFTTEKEKEAWLDAAATLLEPVKQ